MTASISHPLNAHPWPEIVLRLLETEISLPSDALSTALNQVARLAGIIADGPLSSKLFGWTSMFDLCIQQTDSTPYSGPYLKVSPQKSGSVEFRYIDTALQARQWNRDVPPDAVIAQFLEFLEQLHWIA